MSISELHGQLAKDLQNLNTSLTYEEARSWVEFLWEDFETTRAKAGYKYRGQEMTQQIVRQWIQNYGPRLHDYFSDNPKFQHLLKNKGIQH